MRAQGRRTRIFFKTSSPAREAERYNFERFGEMIGPKVKDGRVWVDRHSERIPLQQHLCVNLARA
jgi:hypothetical protein